METIKYEIKKSLILAICGRKYCTYLKLLPNLFYCKIQNTEYMKGGAHKQFWIPVMSDVIPTGLPNF